MATSFKVIRCAECGAEIDRVEYDPDAPLAQVQAVAQALAVSDAAARKIVENATGAKPVSQTDAATRLAEQIQGRAVDGRAKGTYTCPNGHKGDLSVEEITR